VILILNRALRVLTFSREALFCAREREIRREQEKREEACADTKDGSTPRWGKSTFNRMLIYLHPEQLTAAPSILLICMPFFTHLIVMLSTCPNVLCFLGKTNGDVAFTTPFKALLKLTPPGR
jgi:hypothetical protein